MRRPSSRDTEFEEFVRQRRAHLLRTATILTAGDHYLAEDLVQGSLVKLYLAWSRVPSNGGLDAYARRVLVNAFIDHRRRFSVARETVTSDLPDRPVLEDEDGLTSELLQALAGLPARMRAAVVLRHVLNLSVEDAAQALGCSAGTLRSQTSRGLAKLREVLPTSSRQPLHLESHPLQPLPIGEPS